MFKKNTPLKVVLVIFITEIIILIGLGIALQTNIIGLHNQIEQEEVTSLSEIDLDAEIVELKIPTSTFVDYLSLI